MQHGLDNEINGIGTIVGRILPVYLPSAKFHEEGYYKMAHDGDPNFLIVSPDGSCRVNDDVQCAIEIKCPVPGKEFTTDVHYAIPKYYVTQVLAEMAALKCEKLLYVSWTPVSTTVLRVTFDETLWDRINSELQAVYRTSNGAARPSKKRPTVSQLMQDIKLFTINNVELLCEIPSVKCIQCSHSSMEDLDGLTISHSRNEMSKIKLQKESEEKTKYLSLEAILTILSKGKTSVNDAYNILRAPAKEVLVAVLSDLDRQSGPNSVHGIPVAYGLSGYSLKVENMRSLMEDIIDTCYKAGISVKSLSTDGQFYRLCVRDKQDKPLTVLQVAKDTWGTVKKMTKSEQISRLMELNYAKHANMEDVCNALESNLLMRGECDQTKGGPIIVTGWKNSAWPKLYNPRKLAELAHKRTKHQTDEVTINRSDLHNMPVDAANDIFEDIGDEAVCMHDSDAINESRDTGKDVSHKHQSSENTAQEQQTRTKHQTDEVTINISDLFNMPVDSANDIFEDIGDEAVCMHDSDAIDESRDTGKDVSHKHQSSESTAQEQQTTFAEDDTMEYVENLAADARNSRVELDNYSEEFIQEIISGLRKFDKGRKKSKWTHMDSDLLKAKLKADPALLMKSFTKSELLACAEPFKCTVERVTVKQINQLSKLELANAFSAIFGPSTILCTKKSPPKLRRILKDLLSSFGKEALNAITATRQFLDIDLPTWRQHAAFKDGTYLGSSDRQYVWYSQPEYFANVAQFIVYLLDCHHLFVNARSYVCQHGIDGLNVHKDAWIDVAESKHGVECGLNTAMVKDLIDKQSNAIAQIVFSENVERNMVELGWANEAHFCKCIREWYKAEDEAGLSVATRHSYRMNMRNMLLKSVNLADFPPPGWHISGMPVVMFEGILTNIDRRYQLHAMVPGNAYNVRAPNTLAVENLFGGFQDLDPKSTGVLLADDIPHAIETASYLIQSRLDPDRPFEMRTAKSSRVYPAPTLHMQSVAREVTPSRLGSALTRIPLEPHIFDLEQAKKNPKRKTASIPDYRQPSRGTQPVRQHHKADSSKILPHVRHGLKFDS